MRKRTDIELPVRTSVACHWRHLSGEIQDALVDAVHHPRVLDGSLQPCLHVEITARLLPPDPHDCDMRALSRLLADGCIDHLFQCRQTLNAHCIRIRLSPFADQDMSRIVESLRITHNPNPKPVRRTNMTISNLHQPQRSNLHNNRSIPMNKPKLSDIPPATSRKLKKKSWFGNLIDWLFGPAETVEKYRGEPIVDPIDTNSQIAPTDSWLEAFNQALTQATADFIRRQVEPLHREDPSCGFSIRAVKVGMTEATRPCLEAVEKLPPDLCSRIAKIRMQQAPGAQQIRLDNFFGISIDADSALLDGPVVQTLVSYGGKRVQLKFRFDGDYVTLPAINMNSPIDRNTPAASEDRDIFGPSIKKQTILKSPNEPIYAGIKKGTVLRENIELPTQPIIAKLHIKPWDSDEIVVEINDNELPYTIGREPQGHGFIVESDNEESVAAVSRRHLILESFDSLAGHFFVYNPGANGTYDKGRAMPERFIHVCHNDHWLSLGGVDDGAGTVQIALELVK